MIGPARIVALGEAVHGSAEALELRNRLFRYLVEEKGFTAIAIESGLVESHVLNDYVRGASIDAEEALATGISWTFHTLPQNRDLICWLRKHNARAGSARKLNFYGFDISGSPGNSKASRGVDTALLEALRFLSIVDTKAAGEFEARLGGTLLRLRFALYGSNIPGYERLNTAERDALTAAVADLVTQFERSEARYTAASDAVTFAWAHRAAIGARQIDSWLRQIPPGWQPTRELPAYPSEQIEFLPLARETRSRAQADNLEWIVREEGEQGKILVFAHRYHVSAAPVVENAWKRLHGVGFSHEVAGTYLRRRFADELLTIGNLVGAGETAQGDQRETLRPAASDNLDGLAREIGGSGFALDLRRAPPDVAAWLEQEQYLAHGPQEFSVVPMKAFDLLVYMDTISSAYEQPREA